MGGAVGMCSGIRLPCNSEQFVLQVVLGALASGESPVDPYGDPRGDFRCYA
jgi:hypothetical protein